MVNRHMFDQNDRYTGIARQSNKYKFLCVSIHTCISWFCPLRRGRSSNTPLTHIQLACIIPQIVVLNIILNKWNQGHVVDSRSGTEKIQDEQKAYFSARK